MEFIKKNKITLYFLYMHAENNIEQYQVGQMIFFLCFDITEDIVCHLVTYI